MTGFQPHLPEEVKCGHCRWSVGRADRHLFCTLIQRVVVFPCRQYEREPGSDDELGEGVKTRAAS